MDAVSVWDSGGRVTPEQIIQVGFRKNEEHYIGEGQANAIETSATRAGSMLARLITDKDLLDTIFSFVEPDKYGRVPASKLIELIKLTMNGDYEELELALDPMGLDMSIDLDTFKTVIFNWEGKQNAQDFFIPQTTSTPLNSPKSSHKLNGTFDFDDLNFLHVSSPDDDQIDTFTLENEISQLKFKNSKLEKENRELENQVTNLELLYGNSQHECENLKHRNQSLQNQMQTTQAELDLSVTKHADESGNWNNERAILMNERNDLERQVKDLKDELNETLVELTNLRNNEEAFTRNYSERENTFMEAITERDLLEEKLSQTNNNCLEFKERLLETLRNNEHLRKKRHDLQEELIILYEKFCLNNFNTEIEEIEDNVVSLDVTLENRVGIDAATITKKFERESSIFDELMLDSETESTFVHPICGKPPALDSSHFQSPNYGWKPLETLGFLIEQISSQLNEVCAAELLENANQNSNHMLPSVSEKIEAKDRSLYIQSLDLGSNDAIPSPGSLSPDSLRHHINAQLQMLHKHIAKSQNILISLQAISMPLIAKSSTTSSPIEPYQSTDFITSQTPDHPKRSTQTHYDTQNSTPSHGRTRTRSCPILPSETTFITMGTQTEPIFSKDANTRLQQAFNHTSFASPGISIAPDFTDYDLDSITPMPRNRSSSYSEAIKRGNKEAEENEELRLNRHLSVLQEEEHENSDSSPLICRSKLTDPRLPPPYRPPPPFHNPSSTNCRSWESTTRIPIINVQPSTPSVEFLPNDQRFAQEIHLSLPSQRQRKALVRQMSDPFPAQMNSNQFIVCPPQLMPCVFHSFSPETFDCFDVQQHLYYVSSYNQTPLVTPSPTWSGKESSTIAENDVTSDEHLAQTSQPSMIAVSDSGVSTGTEKISDAEESDEEEFRKKALIPENRRRRRNSGSNGNNSPVFQRSKAVDFDFGYDIYECNSCKDDSDVDVKKDILEGMTQVTNRKTFSPPPLGGTPEFIISTSPKSSVEIHQPCFRRKVGESQRRLLMPELMENSETESAKNSGESMESETEQIIPTSTDIINPPPPAGDGPFPSLPDNFLKLLQLHKSSDKIERFTEKDVEAKFHSLLLSFRTDKFTLTNRLDLHQRQRDIAEKNIDEEVIALKENLNALSQMCNDQETREIVKRLHHHLDVLHQSTARMSSRAEVYGAVQQEDRTNRAIEVMLLYVENLKRGQEKNAAEFEDMRRIMVENNLLSEDGSENEETRRNLRSYSMSNSSIGKQASKRRASIAALPRSASERLDGNTKFINFVNTSRGSICSIGSRRCSLYYNLRPSFSSDPEKVVKRHAADDLLIPSSSSVEHSDDEHLHRPKRLPISRRGSKRDSIVSKNSESLKLPSPDSENADSVFASGDKVADSDTIDSSVSNIKMDSNGGKANWHITDYRTEPSSDEEDEDEYYENVAAESIRSKYSARFRPSIAGTAANLLNVSHWVNDEHLVYGVRCTIGGILFVAAIFSLLMAFFPGSQASHSCNQISNWYYSIDELIRPHLQLRHPIRPPM